MVERQFRNHTARRFAAFLAGISVGMAVSANPVDPQVVHGQASFSNPSPNTLQIANSPNAIINWQGFSIGAGETTRFIQNSAASAVLNRVTGNNLSQIMGALRSNGRVFLVNPHGIVVGPRGVIDTAGFIASTLNITNENFLKGDYRFEMGPEEAGAITLEEAVNGEANGVHNGSIYLIAPDIENRGILKTENGDLVLAAGEKVMLASLDHRDVRFELQAPENGVVNLGRIESDGGAVGIFAGTLKHSGEIRASGLQVGDNGAIELVAKSDLQLAAGSSISADGATGGAIRIESLEGSAQVAGEVTAKGSQGKGGNIRILGEHVELTDSALVDASGATGGGEVLVGGDERGENPLIHNAITTQVAYNAVIKADAIESGDGGRAIVWADDTTLAYGRISVRGGEAGGDGGFVETSGRRFLDIGEIAPDIAAPNGKGGTWLIDPEEITIDSRNWGYSSFVDVATLIADLNAGGTVEIVTSGSIGGSGDINLRANINKTSGGNAMLKLSAHRDINLNDRDITSTSGQLNMLFNADSDNSGGIDGGQVNLAWGVHLDANGGTIDATGETIEAIDGGQGVASDGGEGFSNFMAGLIIIDANLNADRFILNPDSRLEVNGRMTLAKGVEVNGRLSRGFPTTFIDGTGELILGGSSVSTVKHLDINLPTVENHGVFSMVGDLSILRNTDFTNFGQFSHPTLGGADSDLDIFGDFFNPGTTTWTDPDQDLELRSTGRIINTGTFNIVDIEDLDIDGGTVINEGLAIIDNADGIYQRSDDGFEILNGGQFINRGVLQLVKHPGSGLINEPTGTLVLPSGATIEVPNGYTHTGTLNIGPGSTVLVNGTEFINNGTITGQGTLAFAGPPAGTGDFMNSGLIGPGSSPGMLTINGNLVLGPTSTLDIELGGANQGVDYDWLNVTGNATLDGVLNVLLFGGFTGLGGIVFEPLTCGGVCTGTFATETMPPGFTIGYPGSLVKLTGPTNPPQLSQDIVNPYQPPQLPGGGFNPNLLPPTAAGGEGGGAWDDPEEMMLALEAENAKMCR